METSNRWDCMYLSLETQHCNVRITNLNPKGGSLHKKVVWIFPFVHISQFDLGMPCPINKAQLQKCKGAANSYKTKCC